MQYREETILHNLGTFAGSRSGPRQSVLSVKLRPVADAKGPSDRYVYPAEYGDLIDEFDLAPQDTHDYSAQSVYGFRDEVVLLEHETGPEIICFLKELGDAAGPYLNVIEIGAIVFAVGNWLRGKIKENCDDKSADRHYHDANYLRIETRKAAPDGSLREVVATTLRLDQPVDERALTKALEKALGENHHN